MKITRKQLIKLIQESASEQLFQRQYDVILEMLSSNSRAQIVQALELAQYLEFEKTDESGKVELTSVIEPDSVSFVQDLDPARNKISAQINYVTLGYHLHIGSKVHRSTHVMPVPYTAFTGNPDDYPMTFEFFPTDP